MDILERIKEIPYPVGGCSCITKTPNPLFHSVSCPVKQFGILQDVAKEIAQRDETIQRLLKERKMSDG